MDERDDERDLLAWVDGQLDGDPVFKAAVETRVRQDPDLLERARAYAAQTETLRAAFDERLADPVPARLLQALEPKPRRVLLPVLRAAAVAVALITVGVGGWVLGERSDDDWSIETLLERSYRDFSDSRPSEPAAPAVEAAVTEGRPLAWLHDEVEIRVKAPDLSDMGYALVDKRGIRFGPDDHVVRLDYAAADGKSFSLFLAPRWDNRPSPVVEAERDGVASAFWVDGPLASTVLSRLPPKETRRVAEAARRAMAEDGARPPVVKPGPLRPGTGRDGIVADVGASSERAPSARGTSGRSEGVKAN